MSARQLDASAGRGGRPPVLLLGVGAVALAGGIVWVADLICLLLAQALNSLAAPAEGTGRTSDVEPPDDSENLP